MVKQETPAPTGIEALTEVVGFVQAVAPHEEHSVWDALDIVEAALRSQSRALAEREEEADRMRYYLKLVLDVGQADKTRDVTPETAISLAQTWAGLALRPPRKARGKE